MLVEAVGGGWMNLFVSALAVRFIRHHQRSWFNLLNSYTTFFQFGFSFVSGVDGLCKLYVIVCPEL